MRRHYGMVLCLLVSSWALAAGAVHANAVDAFERLKGLVGEWEGSFEWSGARSGGGEIRATYSLSGYGSTVIENLFDGTEISMTSVYHLDGEELRMTHFCAAANQPRLRASSTQGDILRFEFVDITNLADPADGHVHGFELHFKGPDHLNLRFTFLQEGKESYENVELTRMRSR